MVNQIDTQKFDALIKESSKPVVCDFFATWCGPCKMLAPVMDQLAEEYGEKAEFVKVDIDENFDLAARYGIQSIPLVAVFKDGELADKSLGFMPKSEAAEFVEKNL